MSTCWANEAQQTKLHVSSKHDRESTRPRYRCNRRSTLGADGRRKHSHGKQHRVIGRLDNRHRGTAKSGPVLQHGCDVTGANDNECANLSDRAGSAIKNFLGELQSLIQRSIPQRAGQLVLVRAVDVSTYDMY